MKEQIEEMRNDQIGEIAVIIYVGDRFGLASVDIAERLYNAGYRKQKEGEWIENPIDNYDGEPSGLYYVCSVCHTENGFEDTPFCPNCGAHMKADMICHTTNLKALLHLYSTLSKKIYPKALKSIWISGKIFLQRTCERRRMIWNDILIECA